MLVATQVAFLFLFWCFYPTVFFPSPGEVLGALGSLWREGLLVELVTSLTLNLEALAVATAVSLGLSYLSLTPFFRPVVAFLCKLRFLSLLGLSFFFTLITKDGHSLKLYVLVFSIAVFFVTSMVDVVQSVPKAELDLARTLRMSPWSVVWQVVVRGQADKAFDVLRQNAAIGWLMLTVVEGMSRAEGGIGAMLLTQNKHFHIASVIALQGVILLVGIAQDYGIGALRNMFCPYANLSTERM
jgi:NitT/TauT family transport system permease protein